MEVEVLGRSLCQGPTPIPEGLWGSLFGLWVLGNLPSKRVLPNPITSSPQAPVHVTSSSPQPRSRGHRSSHPRSRRTAQQVSSGEVGRGAGGSGVPRSPAILTPTPLPGSCVRIVGSCLRTSCCRLESSPSSGRTWVCPGGPEGRVLEGCVFGSTPGWAGGRVWERGSLDGAFTHPLQAGCTCSMATRLLCSSRASRPLWSTPETCRLISSALGPEGAHPTPVVLWEATLGSIPVQPLTRS